MDTSNYIEIINIIATIILFIWGYFLNNKINSINLNTVFYNEIFNDILLKKLPAAAEETLKNNFSNFDAFDDVLVELNKNILYLKFKNKNFYTKVEKEIIKIDDFLSHLYKTTIKPSTKNQFEKLIEDLYQVIYENYNK